MWKLFVFNALVIAGVSLGYLIYSGPISPTGFMDTFTGPDSAGDKSLREVAQITAVIALALAAWITFKRVVFGIDGD